MGPLQPRLTTHSTRRTRQYSLDFDVPSSRASGSINRAHVIRPRTSMFSVQGGDGSVRLTVELPRRSVESRKVEALWTCRRTCPGSVLLPAAQPRQELPWAGRGGTCTISQAPLAPTLGWSGRGNTLSPIKTSTVPFCPCETLGDALILQTPVSPPVRWTVTVGSVRVPTRTRRLFHTCLSASAPWSTFF